MDSITLYHIMEDKMEDSSEAGDGVLKARQEAEKFRDWIFDQQDKKVAQEASAPKPDNVAYPSHYTSVVPNIECIQVTRHMNFCRGSAIKYLWRAGHKDKQKEIEDLRKAIQFIEFEIQRIMEEG